MLSSFQFYKIYQSLNLHFTSNSFDFFKYGFNSKSVNKISFDNRRDRMRFDVFSNKLMYKDTAFNFCVSNFVHNEENWIYNDYQDAESIYKQWLKYINSFTYSFKREFKYLESIKEENSVYFQNLLYPITTNSKPPLLQLTLHGRFTPEFICTLDNKFKFLNMWKDENQSDPFVSKKIQNLIKYTKLLTMIRSKRSEHSQS